MDLKESKKRCTGKIWEMNGKGEILKSSCNLKNMIPLFKYQ